MIQMDTNYFGRIVVAPFNLIFYNVFTSHGPNLYGTEPWHFYFVNGFLNFNIAFVLALLPIPLYYFSLWLQVPLRDSLKSLWLILSPLYLWLVVFIAQSHKEERFLFPIYPLFCVASAVSIDILRRTLVTLHSITQKWMGDGVSSLVLRASSVLPVTVLTISCVLSVSRIVAQYKGTFISI